MIITVTLNPALDKTVEIPDFSLDAVNRITAMRTDPGGKGLNVSKVIAKLGGTSTVVGVLGGTTGRRIADAMDALGIACQFTFVDGETRTNLKVIDPARHTNTDLNEPGLTVDQETLDHMRDALVAAIRPGDIVVLSGSLPKGAPADTYGSWTAACRTAGARVFLDADGEPLAHGLAAKPYLAKPNNHELSRLTGRALETADDLLAAARTLIADGVERVVVSMGGDGALFVSADGAYRAEGLRVPVGSTVGAGDSMVAALAYAAEQGMADADTVRLAVATSAANVMCSGSQAAERSAVDELLPHVVFHEI
ncbi:MAG TPA: 1-phosphofructokinase [Candidatus Butyricicoccus avicola]|nr:1-phosphofructokinase [Candidatus Butyricicoccus avicola]